MADKDADHSAEELARLLRESDHIIETATRQLAAPSRTESVHVLSSMSPHHHDEDPFEDYVGDEWTPGYRYTDMGLLEPVRETPVVIPDASDQHQFVQLLISMRAGGLAPSYVQVLEEVGVEIETLQVADEDLTRWFEFAWMPSDLRGNTGVFIDRWSTPLGRTTAGCTFFHPVGVWDERVYPIVVGDSPNDFFLALAYDRLLDGAAWFPTSLLDGGELQKAAGRGLGRTLWNLDPPNSLARRCVLVSTSEPRESLERVHDLLRGWSLDENLPDISELDELDLPSSTQRMWDIEANRLSRIEPFIAGRQATRLEHQRLMESRYVARIFLPTLH